MPQNSRNGKVAYDVQATSEKVSSITSRYNQIAFQTYTGITHIKDETTDKWIEAKDWTSRTQTKEEVKVYCNSLRGKAKNWKDKPYSFPTESGLNTLIQTLNKGVAVHFCITSKSCGHEDVDYVDTCFADYDAINKDGTVKDGAATIEELLSLPTIQKYCVFYQASSKGLPNGHFQFVYEKSANFSDHTLMLTCLVTRLNDELRAIGKEKLFDASLQTNSTHLCYAGKTDCVFIERTPGLDNEYGDLIPVDWIQEARNFGFKAFREDKRENNSFPEINSTHTPESEKSKHLQHIYNHLIERFHGDWRLFYNLIDHQWQDTTRSIPDDAIGQCDGQNPFSPTNSSGTSLSITAFEGNLPPVFLDRKNNRGGDLIDYFYHWGRLSGDYQNGGVRGNFKAIVNEICKHFEIPEFEWKKKSKSGDDEDELQSVLENVRYSFVNDADIYIKKAKWSNSDLYLYYCFKGGVWRLAESFKTVYSECIQYFIDCPNNLLLHKKVKAVCQNLLEYSDNLQHIESKLDFDKLSIRQVIPLANGDYDTKTGELTAYSPEICNMKRSKVLFREVDENSKGVALFKYWLGKQYQTPEQKMLESWIILNCLGRATETKRMLNVYGTPETGKTVILTLIQNLLGNLAVFANAKNFLMDGNKFANQRLNGTNALLLDEFSTNLDGWNQLKKLSGNSNMTIEVEQKGMTPYETLFYGGITTATQDNFYIPNGDDGGIRRRIVLLKHTSEMKRDEFKNIDNEFARPEIYEDIFLWAIQQDSDKALETFLEYAKTSNKENIREVVLDNDKVLMFMNECLDFTNEESHELSNIAIQEAYKYWLFDVYGESLEQNKLAKISQYIREKASIPDNKIDWKFIPEKGKEIKVKREKHYYRGFKGVRFNKDSVKISIN